MNFYEKVQQAKQVKQAEKDALLQQQLKLDQERDQVLAGFQGELTGWLDAIGIDYEVDWRADASSTDDGRCVVLQGRIELYHEDSHLESVDFRHAKRIFQDKQRGTTHVDTAYGSHWTFQVAAYSVKTDIKNQQELEDYLVKLYADRI